MRNMKLRILFGALLSAFVLWAVCAALDAGGQRELFCNEGKELLSDYWMPQTCLAEGYAERDEDFTVLFGLKRSGWVNGKMCVVAYDRCYPAFALLPLKAFPATWGGAWAWIIVSTLLLIGVLCGLARSWWPLVLLGSMPVLFNVERGNQVAVAAALIGIFLAWYRSEVRWKWAVAALALSAATCFKVTPVVLGVLYLREKDWKGIGLCAVFCSAMFFISWLFVPDGFAGLPMMLENARMNGLVYARSAEFGLVDFWRTARVALHQNCTRIWPGLLVATRLSQILGLAMVAYGAWKRNLVWAVVGMLWAAGNMHYYGALYLLPLLVLVPPSGWCEAAMWFVALCPLQIMLAGHSANGVLCNLAAVGLCVASGISARRQLSA